MAIPLPSQDFEPAYYEVQAFVKNEKAPVFHAFFGRNFGKSKGVYSSLNCGTGSEDHSDMVHENRQVVAELAGCAADNIVTVHQVHSAICAKVEKPWPQEGRPQADALVTDVPGLALAVLTADCAPVLFYADVKGKPVIGAAHAGWRGALEGVLESTVEALEALGAQREEIRACIGPCIGVSSYEVQERFAEPFLKESEENERFFKSARRQGRLMFDLAGYCAAKLAGQGLRNVFIKDLDTYFNEEDFFSYRRATHRGEKDYGRQMSLIVIKA